MSTCDCVRSELFNFNEYSSDSLPHVKELMAGVLVPDKWLKDGVLRRSFRSLIWWMKIGRGKFPILYHLAIKVLSVCGAGAEVERMWSTGGLIVTKLRCSTAPHRVASLILAKLNAQYQGGQVRTVLGTIYNDE